MSTIPIKAWPRINVTMPQITRATAMSQSIGAISTSHRYEMDVRRIGKRVPPYEAVHSLSANWSFALTFIARSLSGITSANETGPRTSAANAFVPRRHLVELDRPQHSVPTKRALPQDQSC